MQANRAISLFLLLLDTLKIYAADFVNNQRESRLSSLDPLYSTKESYNVLLALFLAIVKTRQKFNYDSISG